MSRDISGSGRSRALNGTSARAGGGEADDPEREDPDPVVVEARAAIRIVLEEAQADARVTQIGLGAALGRARETQTARETVFVEAQGPSDRASDPTTRIDRHEILGETLIACGMVLAEAVAHSTGGLARTTLIVHPLI